MITRRNGEASRLRDYRGQAISETSVRLDACGAATAKSRPACVPVHRRLAFYVAERSSTRRAALPAPEAIRRTPLSGVTMDAGAKWAHAIGLTIDRHHPLLKSLRPCTYHPPPPL